MKIPENIESLPRAELEKLFLETIRKINALELEIGALKIELARAKKSRLVLK